MERILRTFFAHCTHEPIGRADLQVCPTNRFVERSIKAAGWRSTAHEAAQFGSARGVALTVHAAESNSGFVMRTYDLVMTHKLDADDFFIHRVQQHCAERGMNFFLIDPLWAETFHEKLSQGKVWARVLINMHSEHHQPEDLYHRLVNLAFERKTRVIDPPDLARSAFDKASLHPRLLAAGFTLPHTVIVSGAQEDGWDLCESDRAKLGETFVIKPGMGYGKRGVILNATSPQDIVRSRREWPDTHYLLQERIVPRQLDGAPAYFRVFFVFGALWFAWWNCYSDQYRLLTDEELKEHRLQALAEIVGRLAAFTRMNFFSSEIALTDAGEFVLIDYVNDQCHMLTQSANPAIGVPDAIVAGVARQLVDGAQRLICQPV